MRNAHGYGIESGPGGTREHDTCQCKHCGNHFPVKAFQDPKDAGAYCSNCDGAVCPRCAASGRDCFPFEKLLELWETGNNYLRMLGRG